MKIGIVLSQVPSYSETFFVSKIKGLLESGYDVTLFVQRKASDFKLCPVKVAPRAFKKNVLLQLIYGLLIGLRLLGYPKRIKTFIKLEKRAKRSKKQILKNIYNNSHMLTAQLDWVHFGFATMALNSENVAKAIDAKMAVSFRGFDVAIYPLKHPNCYNLLWTTVDKVHTISNDLLFIARNLGLPEDVQVEKITPAIDCGQFSMLKKKTKFISDSKINLATVGRLHWKKGYIDTLEALAILKKKGIDFTYAIVGDGKDFESIKFAISQLGLVDCVELKGKLPHDDVIGIMNNCDIYLQYSVSEGFCNAVLEAQACGCLCIVSDAEGLAENILHERTGWVVPKMNCRLLADKIKIVSDLPADSRLKIIKSAQERVLMEFNLPLQVNKFVHFYSS